MKIDIGIISHNRYEILSKNLNKLLGSQESFSKIILVDNGSNEYFKKKLKSEFSNLDKIEIISSEINLGVAGARNILFKKSTADLLVCIDDDALMNDVKQSLIRLKKIFSKFDNLGVLCLKIIDSKSKKVIKREFPQKYEFLKLNKILKISYFIGAGFVIKNDVFKKFLFNDNFFYAQEEIDLSYKIIDKNYLMLFDPKISVVHYRDSSSRLSPQKVSELNFKHRMIINYKFLPLKYLIISNFLWTIKTFLSTLSLKVILNSYLYYFKEKRKYKRIIISSSAIKYIKDTNGRLFY